MGLGLSGPRRQDGVPQRGVQMVRGRFAQNRYQRVLLYGRDLPDAANAVVVELASGHRTHTPQVLDGQWMQKRELLAQRHHQQAIRLGDTAGDLGQVLGLRHADGDRQADAVADLAL